MLGSFEVGIPDCPCPANLFEAYLSRLQGRPTYYSLSNLDTLQLTISCCQELQWHVESFLPLASPVERLLFVQGTC